MLALLHARQHCISAIFTFSIHHFFVHQKQFFSSKKNHSFASFFFLKITHQITITFIK